MAASSRAAAALCALLLAVLSRSAMADAIGSKRPNFIVILTDDQRLDDYKYMPNLKKLIMDEGTTFPNSLTGYPLCCPSRATHLTGQYGHNNNVMANTPPKGGYYNLDRDTISAVALEKSGYYNAHIGKYVNYYGMHDRYEVPPGWTEWHATTHESAYAYYNYDMNDDGKINTYPQYQTDHCRDLINNIIRKQERDSRPLYVQLALVAPHAGTPGPLTSHMIDKLDDGGHGDMDKVIASHQLPAEIYLPFAAHRHRGTLKNISLPKPPSFNEPDLSDKPKLFRKGMPLLTDKIIERIRISYVARQETLLAVDELIASVVETLEKTHQLDNTFIIYTSDNGWMQGEHRIPQGKTAFYEESAKVPLVVRGPGVARGVVNTNVVSNIDIVPTMYDYSNTTALAQPDGRSLRPVLSDPNFSWPRGVLIQALSYHAIHTGTAVYCKQSNGGIELYDLVNDPYELENRASQSAYGELETALRTLLGPLSTCAADGCRAADNATLALKVKLPSGNSSVTSGNGQPSRRRAQ